jgi:PAS domain S-box-containing protein
LRSQGRELADCGIVQHSWTRLQLAVRRVVVAFVFDHVSTDEARRSLLVGMERYFEVTHSSVAEGFFEAQQRTARAFEQRERLFRSVVESSADAIISKTIDGTITSWNHAAETLFGYTEEEAMGKNMSMLVQANHAEELATISRRLAEGVATCGLETRRMRQDGTEIDVSLTVSPLLDGDQNVVGASVIARDVTARNRNLIALERAQADLERTVRTLKRSNEDLEQFAYIASHDLQEPLRMVTSYMGLLEQAYGDQLDAQANQFIHYAVDGSRRMKRLVNDLLTYSRINMRGSPPERCAAQKIVDHALQNLAVAIQEADAMITHRDLPVIWGDPIQVQQVFQNLLSNAIKFRGLARPVIHVSATREVDCWRFTVEDNGIGFEAKHSVRIFQMFQRLHERSKYAGSGIGLAISKRIVERHGGRIWAEGTPGVGSRFIFELPVGDPGARGDATSFENREERGNR